MDNKSKTPPIRYIQKNRSLMKINNIILVLSTRAILSSFVIYFLYTSLGKFSYYILEGCRDGAGWTYMEQLILQHLLSSYEGLLLGS